MSVYQEGITGHWGVDPQLAISMGNRMIIKPVFGGKFLPSYSDVALSSLYMANTRGNRPKMAQSILEVGESRGISATPVDWQRAS